MMEKKSKLSPLHLDKWDATLADVIDDMQGAPLNVHALMAHHPPLLAAWWPLRNYLVEGGSLDRRQAEMIILRVACRLNCWYEWASHVVRGLDCGLSEEEIGRVKLGAQAHGWKEEDSLLLQALDELLSDRAISPATRDALSRHFNKQQIFDLIAIQGMYLTLGGLIKTYGVELDARVGAKLPATVTEESFRSF